MWSGYLLEKSAIRATTVCELRRNGATLKAIGVAVGVSHERVRQILFKHQRILWRMLQARGLAVKGAVVPDGYLGTDILYDVDAVYAKSCYRQAIPTFARLARIQDPDEPLTGGA